MTRSLTMVITCFMLPSIAAAQIKWTESSTGSDASLRGISVVGGKTIWACGSVGTVVRTNDGGKSWNQCGPSEFNRLEFRSIAAFSDQDATIASAGTPAVILQTRDGGKTWQERYRNEAKTAFFDALKFWNVSGTTARNPKQGIACSDPVDGRFLVVTTSDGGDTWKAIDAAAAPAARDDEAAFAASNSSLLVGKNGVAWFGTGGAASDHSRVLFSEDYGQQWAAFDCPISSGQAAGIFSIASSTDETTLIAVGGDSRPGEPSKQTAAISRDGGRSWKVAAKPPAAFVSAVTFRADNANEKWIAVGPTGSFASADGDHWERFSNAGFHAIAVSDSGTILAVGSAGRFAFSTGK